MAACVIAFWKEEGRKELLTLYLVLPGSSSDWLEARTTTAFAFDIDLLVLLPSSLHGLVYVSVFCIPLGQFRKDFGVPWFPL